MGIEARQRIGVSVMPTAIAPSHRLRGRERTSAGLPPEIAFLAGQGVAPDLLLRAAAGARRSGVTADRALLADGFPAGTFHSLLARHLGVPFVDEPMRLDLPPEAPLEGLASGVVPLAANRRRIDRLMAPRGQRLVELLREVASRQGGPHRFGIATPRHIEALGRDQAGSAIADQASLGLSAWDESLSARTGLRRFQLAAAAVSFALFGAVLAFDPAAALGAAKLLFSILFLASILLRLSATSLNVARKPAADRPVPETELPVYTILIPLYREVAIVPRLIQAMDRLDYPKAKLDIKILIEADDPDMRDALEAAQLPERYDIVVVPPGHPRTKPRALNVGLLFARGDLVVVYDAEDVPAPGQLKAAAARFKARPGKVVGLQARLAIDHLRLNWLSLMFGLEYAALFGVIKPGLMTARLPIPLGGTSNHFRGLM